MTTRKKVLIAEDDPASRELLAEMLSSLGYEVVQACDGGELLSKLEQTEPALILLDIQMPVLDGFAVVRRLRKDPRFRRVPVVAVTAYAMQGDRETALQWGFAGYVPKPIELAVLRAEIERHFEIPGPDLTANNTSTGDLLKL